MKQKVFALVLSCMMLLSLVVSAASYSDVPETHDRYEAINMLSSLDIITGYPDGTFQPDKEVTRAEMAALITRMFNLTSTAVTEQPFSDVATDYWAVSNIVAAKNMKIINGFPDGTFKPQDNVTYEQAVKMIVCALNYGTAAEALGGYPAGYINQASKLNILQKAAYGNTKPAPRGIIAQLLFNSLKVDMLVPQVNPDGTVDYIKSESGNSVLEQFQKTQTLTGVTVVRTPRVNLEPGVTAIQSVNDDAMFVKTSTGEYVKLKVGTYTDAFSFIGQQVDVSYRVDEAMGDTKTLTSITKSSSVKSYENIKLSDVISLTNTELVYYTDKANDRKNTLRLSGTPTVIYNERLHSNGIAQLNTDLFSVANHEYVNGVISLYVGTNTLIKAKAYKTYVVETNDYRNEVIKVKGSVIGGTPQPTFDLTIPHKDAYINETVIRKGNFDFGTGAAVSNASKLTSYSSIAKGNIIAVASNARDTSNAYYEVLISSNTLSGTVNGIETDDETGRSLIQVGTGSKVRLSRELDRYEMTPSVQIEVNAKFHIDPFGEVGYVSDIKTQDIKFGLPVNVTTGGGTGFDKITQLEIYNVDTGSVETLRFRNETSGDPRVAVLKDGSGNLIKDEIFKYTIKNGQIDTLEALVAGTADYTYDASASAVTEVSDITKTTSTKITFDGGKNITFNAQATKIILIGSVYDTGKVTPKALTRISDMSNNTAYTGRVYKMNNKKSGTNYNMQYVIIRPFEGITKDSPTYIVDSVGGIVLQGDVNTVTVKAYPFTGTSTGGSGASLAEIVMTDVVASALNLQKGDVFTYYDVPSANVDIETLRNVFILARANEIATGTYPTAGAMSAADNVENSTGGYNRDYRFLGIQNNTSNLVGPEISSVYTYYMGIPLAYSADNLRIAKDAVTDMPVLAGDSAAIAALEADLDNSDNFFDYNVTALANIYVYDAGATDAEKLVQIKGKDLVHSYLENLRTVENNASNTTKAHDTLFVRTYNNTSGNSFYNLYIIKDARPVNP